AIEFFTLGATDGAGEQYYALVWTPRGVAGLRDLGLTVRIQSSAQRYRLAVSVPDNREQIAEAGAELARLLLEPLADLLPSEGQLYLAPDAELVGLPLDLLPLSVNQRLGERYQISMLGSVRDLARWARQESSRIDEVGFFDPDFGPAAAGERPEFV